MFKLFSKKSSPEKQPPQSVFKKPLESLPMSKNNVPVFYEIICNELFNHTNEVGLFRKCGSAIVIEHLSQLAMNKDFQIPPNTSVNDMTSFIKQWLRELPDPIITPNIVNEFCKKNDPRSFAEILKHLNESNRKVIATMFAIMQLTADQSQINLMTLPNLFICIQPSILQKSNYGSNFEFNKFFNCCIGLMNADGNDFLLSDQDIDNMVGVSHPSVPLSDDDDAFRSLPPSQTNLHEATISHEFMSLPSILDNPDEEYSDDIPLNMNEYDIKERDSNLKGKYNNANEKVKVIKSCLKHHKSHGGSVKKHHRHSHKGGRHRKSALPTVGMISSSSSFDNIENANLTDPPAADDLVDKKKKHKHHSKKSKESSSNSGLVSSSDSIGKVDKPVEAPDSPIKVVTDDKTEKHIENSEDASNSELSSDPIDPEQN